MSRIVLAMASALLVAVPAVHAEEIFRDGADWTVTVDRSGPACLAVQKGAGSGGMVMRKDGSSFTVSLVDQKLSWLEEGKQYQTDVIIDRTEWTGTMTGTRGDGVGALHLVSPVQRFVTALERGGRVSVSVDGTRYGPYSLKGSRGAISDLDDCLLAAADPVSAPSEQSAFLPEGWTQEWSEKDFGRIYKSGDVTLRMSKHVNLDDSSSVTVEVHKKGMVPVTFDIEGSPSPTGRLGLVRLEPWNKEYQLLFTNFTGGTHCCTEARAVDFSGGWAKLIEFGSYDAGDIEPQDVDGDGYYEIVVPDDRFRSFSSFAESFPPQLIFGIKNGKAENVTARPQFAAHHEIRFRQQAEVCGTVANENPGACAGMVGTAATLGLLNETLWLLDFDTKPQTGRTAPFQICADAHCSKTEETDDFKKALLHAIDVWGISVRKSSPAFTDGMEKLVGREFGAKDRPSETVCGEDTLRFSRSKGLLDKTVFILGDYETNCAASDGLAVGSALLAKVVCQGEGMPPWIENRLYDADGMKLTAATFEPGAPSVASVVELSECPAQ